MRFRVLARATIVLALACPLGLQALRSALDIAVEQRVRAGLGRLPGVVLGEVVSRGDLGRIEIARLSVARPGWRLDIGSLSIERGPRALPGVTTPALARSSVTRARNVVVSIGQMVVTIPELVALGSDLSADDLAAYANPADAAALKAMLAKLTAASLSAPEVRFEPGPAGTGPAGTGPKPALIVRNLALTDVSAGRIGSLAADGCATAPAAPGTGAATTLSTGAFSISALDLPLILDVATGSRTDADAQPAPLFRSLSLGNLAVADRGGLRWTMGRLSLGALRARPLLVPPSDVGTLLHPSGFGRDATQQQVLGDVLTDAVGSAVVDHAEVDDVGLTNPSDGLVSLKIGRMAFDGLEPLKLRSFAADGMAVEANATAVTLGHLVLSNYDASGFIDVLKQQAFGIAAPVPEGGRAFPPRSSLALADLGIRLPTPPKPGKGGGMPPLQPSDRPIAIPVFSVDGGADAASGVISSHTQMQTVYDFGDDPNFAQAVQLGVKRLDMTAGFALTYDPKAKTLVLDRTLLDMTDLGALSVVARFANVDPAILTAGASPDALLGAGQSATFQSIAVAVANTGLYEKVIPPLAASAKVSVPLFKAQLKAQTEISLNQALGPGPATQRIVSAIKTFIDTPKNLVIAVTAPNGLALGTATAADDPKTLLSQVTVEAAANR